MKIIQLKNYTPSQMTGFVIVTENKKIIVIDGGNTGDTSGFIDRLNRTASEYECESRINLWLLTHPHDDHYGVFRRFSCMQRTGQYTLPDVDCFSYYQLPDEYGRTEHPALAWQLPELNSELAATKIPLKPFGKGTTFSFDNLKIEILRVPNPNITANTINNASSVIRFTEKRPSHDDFVWLVLGDLGVEGGRELLSMYPGGELRADAVQMAHHGQNGVDHPVYEAISPRFAFWTTPDWLWTNTLPGQEPGKGPWATLSVRGWMDEIGAAPIRAAANDLEFDTFTEKIRVLD